MDQSMRSLVKVICSVLICLPAWTGAHGQVPDPAGPTRGSSALRPGDKINVVIWREPDLSGEFVLPMDGTVVFPKIGRLAIGQITPDSLEILLKARYGVSLRDPQITVTPLRRIGVHGAVHSPAYYYPHPTTTVSGTVLLAGGVTSDGNGDRIDLLRDGRLIHLSRSNGAFDGDSFVQSGDEITVPERSWMSRNTALLASTLTGIALVIATVVR